MKTIDVKENHLLEIDDRLLGILLWDQSSQKNIIWATKDYAEFGDKYAEDHEITRELITGENGLMILPRSEKSKEQQRSRSRDMAEVFTPSWVCNAQNNLIDEAWFGRKTGLFNKEVQNGWKTNKRKIVFPKGKTWQQYIKTNRLEITCGEAPYLASRYDTVTGEYIETVDRIGLLDRKLRIISENVDDEYEWLKWAEKALESTYGYDWQGDNVLIARENLLYTTIDFFEEKFGHDIDVQMLLDFATIISWNIWQMDGIKGVIPNSCTSETIELTSLFGSEYYKVMCPGCEKENNFMHNGTYAKIMDWKEKKTIRFVDIKKVIKNG